MQTPPTSSTFAVGQRVSLAYWGKQRQATVMEVFASTGFVRVQIDRATMHEWVSPDVLTLIAEVR